MKARLSQWLTIGLLLTGMNSVLATSSGFRIIPAETITRRVNALITHHYHQSHIRFHIEWLSPPTDWKVESQVDSIAILSPPQQRWRGNTTFNLVAYAAGQILRRRTLSLRIRTFQRVLVLQQAIPRGHPIFAQMLTPQERETTFLKGEPLISISPADTLYARRNIQPGKVLTRQDVRFSLLVRRGETTTLIYQTTHIKIIVQALALADAGEGETIWFIRPENRKRLRATVVARHQAVIQSQNRGMLP